MLPHTKISGSILILVTALLSIGDGCISTAPRAFSAGPAVQQQFRAIPPPEVRPALSAANRGPTEPIHQQQLVENILGPRISLHEFDTEGYNVEGGGPVATGDALTCNFDQRLCCWANVPPPDDQLDWHLASGAPNSSNFINHPVPRTEFVQNENDHSKMKRSTPALSNSFEFGVRGQLFRSQVVGRFNDSCSRPDILALYLNAAEGNYLVAYASHLAPSDEAQFASCAIGCASSPIIVRAKHWQSENVLLQVCQRESFPNTVNFNPLLNCQEFPLATGLATTELVLPKASLIDIVFVASNFVSDQGDLAILDDIEVIYESNGDECGAEPEQSNQFPSGVKETQTGQAPTGLDKNIVQQPAETKLFELASSGDAKGKELFSSPKAAKKSASASSSSSSVSASGSSSQSKGKASQAFASKTSTSFAVICKSIKCTFEGRNICSYKEVHQTESIRGITTSFQVATGQFMNRVTGVKEGTEGDYYAATFLYPREMAGLAVELTELAQPVRLRFQYYEGTHGVQLKGCCDNLEHCLFSSDKFVSVADRMWKLTELTCPAGTTKILFVCENTRTNQGACAIDDIQLIENGTEDLRTARTLC